MQTFIKLCQQCENKFETDREEAKFCSMKCYSQSRLSCNTIVTCKECGKQKDYGTPHFARKREFCSRRCASIYRARNETKRFPTKDDLEQAVIAKIKSAGRYLKLREICSAVKITYRTFRKNKINVYDVNAKAGFDFRRSPYGEVFTRNKRKYETPGELIAALEGYIRHVNRYVTHKEAEAALCTQLFYKYKVCVREVNSGLGYRPKNRSFEDLVFSALLGTVKRDEIEREYRLNCKSGNGRRLRIDFKVGNVLIEADGMQHFRPTNSWHSKEVGKNDQIKNDYCAKNDFTLIRVRESAGWTKARLIEVLRPLIKVANYNAVSNDRRECLKIVTLGQSAAKHSEKSGEGSTTNAYGPNVKSRAMKRHERSH